MERNFVTVDVTINKLLDDKKYKTLRDILTTMNAYDIAVLFGDIHDSKVQVLFRMLPKSLPPTFLLRWMRIPKSF